MAGHAGDGQMCPLQAIPARLMGGHREGGGREPLHGVAPLARASIAPTRELGLMGVGVTVGARLERDRGSLTLGKMTTGTGHAPVPTPKRVAGLIVIEVVLYEVVPPRGAMAALARVGEASPVCVLMTVGTRLEPIQPESHHRI